MFNEYIKKILPIPVTNITPDKEGYAYEITTYSNVLNEYGVERSILKRVKNNKKIESFDGWYINPNNPYLKNATIKFKKAN